MFIHQTKRNKILSIDNLKNFIFFQFLLLAFITYKFDFGSKNIKTIVVIFIFFYFLINEIDFGKRKNIFFKYFLFTGNISYSLYLFHQPIFASVRNYNYHSEKPFNINLQFTNTFNILIIFIFIYLVSYLNFYFIENRYRFANRLNFRNFKYVIYIFSFSIFLIILSLNSNGYEFRDQNMTTFNNKSELSFVQGTNYIAEKNIQCINRDSINQTCSFNTSNKKIYIIGDSVMSSIVSGFAENENLKEYNIVEFTRGACPLLINYCDFYEGSTKYIELLNIKNSIIILGGQYLPYDKNENFEKDLVETIKLLSKNNNVYFYGPFPAPGVNIRMYKQINKEYPDTTQKFIYKEKSKVESILENENIKNLNVINPRDIFCSPNLCKYYSDSHYFYIDHIHFGYYGAEKIASHFVKNYLSESP